MPIPRRPFPEGAFAKMAAPAPRFAYQRRADKAPAFVPSPQQAAFFDWVVEGRGSLLLEAVAGAGKTTTLVQALKLMDGSVFFGAYNRKIANEIKAKAEKLDALRPGLYINTLHGAGFSTWRRACPKLREPNDRKVADICAKIAYGDPMSPYALQQTFICRLVSFGKQFLLGIKRPIDDLDTWFALVDHFGLDEDLPDNVPLEQAVRHAIAVFRISADMCREEIDFDDMIFAPLYHNARIFQNDWVLIDERQDTNPARRELARRMLKRGGRLVAVGDTRQAIYGFTGADGGTEKFVEEFGCAQLPLTVTYRCPKAVVAHARQWVDHITAHEDAPEGAVIRYQQPAPVEGKPAPAWFEHMRPGAEDAVLCRYNAPLVKTAFAMLRAGIPCQVEGRDIGKNLRQLAARWKVRRLDALLERVKAWEVREAARAQAKGRDGKVQEIQDKAETLRVIVARTQERGGQTLDDLFAEIDALFADDVSGRVTLCSGHKSKGREWPRVFWLEAAVRARNPKPWEAIQEDNVKYVICTRAQRELVLVAEAIHSPR